MSDDYLAMMSNNQHQITILLDMVMGLSGRVDALEVQIASLSDPPEYDDEEAAQTYMDGTPVL